MISFLLVSGSYLSSRRVRHGRSASARTPSFCSLPPSAPPHSPRHRRRSAPLCLKLSAFHALSIAAWEHRKLADGKQKTDAVWCLFFVWYPAATYLPVGYGMVAARRRKRLSSAPCLPQLRLTLPATGGVRLRCVSSSYSVPLPT